MSAGREEFERQLKLLGYSPCGEYPDGQTAFEYEVPAGRFKGQKIKIGFIIPPDFPRNPPGGPNVSPPLLPFNPGGNRHPDKTAVSPFGNDWQYWSRPFPGWRGREDVDTYLAYIDRLFGEIS